MSYTHTTANDYDRDGTFDSVVTERVFTDPSGKIDYTIRNGNVLIDASYDELGRLTEEYTAGDHDGDGSFETLESVRHLEYSASGVEIDRTDYPDRDGDGNPDQSEVILYDYDAAGHVTAKETTWLNNGGFNGLDYRKETFSYDAKGHLYEFRIDDWAIYDFDIAFRYQYDNAGRLTKITEENEFKFNDTKFHNAETYKYNSKGHLIERNVYDEYTDTGHVLEIKTKLEYWSDGSLKKELITEQDFSWKTVAREQVEHWYSNGRETTTLTSFDDNLDGKFDPGTRTLEQKTYDDLGRMVSHVVDTNTGDGIAEHVETWAYDDLMV